MKYLFFELTFWYLQVFNKFKMIIFRTFTYYQYIIKWAEGVFEAYKFVIHVFFF